MGNANEKLRQQYMAQKGISRETAYIYDSACSKCCSLETAKVQKAVKEGHVAQAAAARHANASASNDPLYEMAKALNIKKIPKHTDFTPKRLTTSPDDTVWTNHDSPGAHATRIPGLDGPCLCAEIPVETCGDLIRLPSSRLLELEQSVNDEQESRKLLEMYEIKVKEEKVCPCGCPCGYPHIYSMRKIDYRPPFGRRGCPRLFRNAPPVKKICIQNRQIRRPRHGYRNMFTLF